MKLSLIIQSLLENFNLAMRDFSVDNDMTEVKDALDKFRALQSRISDPQEKDINHWRKQGFDNFKTFLIGLETKDSKRQRIKKVKAASSEILTMKKTDNIHLFFPLSKEASCFYGSGTTWCISTRDGKNYFYYYVLEMQRAVLFMIYYGEVFALVIDPANGKISECQDIRNQGFDYNEFLTMAGVTLDQINDFITKNLEAIFQTADNRNRAEKFERFESLINRLATSKSPFSLVNDVVGELVGDSVLTRELLNKRPELKKALEDGILKSHSADAAYLYCHNFRQRWPEAEPIIATSARNSVYYAMNILNGERFKAGEPSIADDPMYAMAYAKHIIDGPWPEGEDAIASDPDYALEYASYILTARFKKGEPAIMSDWHTAEAYKKYFSLD